MKKPKILILFCGGTISMAKNKEGALVGHYTADQLFKIEPRVKELADFTARYNLKKLMDKQEIKNSVPCSPEIHPKFPHLSRDMPRVWLVKNSVLFPEEFYVFEHFCSFFQ